MELVKSSIKDQVHKMLKEKILKQEIEIGEQLNPRDIAENHDISVMPVRDALLRLVNRGLVINKPRVGFFVKTFKAKEIENIMEIRKMYEHFALREHFDAIDRKKIKHIYNSMDNNDELTRNLFDEMDKKIHSTIVEASGNDYLINSYNRIKDLMILFQHLNLQRIDEAHEEHHILIESILDNNQEKAEKVLIEHLKMVTLSIMENIKKSESD